MNQPIHNDYWLSRFESILDSALAQHRAVSLIRVDLRFPEHMPVTIMDPDPDSAVISRFFASLKAKIQAYQRKKKMCQSACACNQPALFLVPGVRQDVWQETLSRDITAQQRYLVLARGFQRTVFAGDDDPGGMVQRPAS